MTRPSRSAASLADRVALLIEGLRRAVASRAAENRALAPLLLLVWSRLRRMADRFAALARRADAGTTPRRKVDRPRPSGARERLPASFAWLVRLVPEAACYGAQLQHLLSEPGMAELLSAAPQAGRVLRPLCRMLAVEPSPELSPTGFSPAPVRERSPPKRESRGEASVRGPVRARRRPVPRLPGLALLRWRPAGASG